MNHLMMKHMKKIKIKQMRMTNGRMMEREHSRRNSVELELSYM